MEILQHLKYILDIIWHHYKWAEYMWNIGSWLLYCIITCIKWIKCIITKFLKKSYPFFTVTPTFQILQPSIKFLIQRKKKNHLKVNANGNVKRVKERSFRTTQADWRNCHKIFIHLHFQKWPLYKCIPLF